MVNFNSPQGSVFIKPQEINVDFKKHVIKEVNITWYTFNDYKNYNMIGQFCELCGEIISIPDFNPFEENNYIEQMPCRTADSILTETILSVASGKIIFSNGIINEIKTPQVFQKDLIHSSTTSKQGRINNLKIYERIGVLAVFTKGSPKIYKRTDGNIVIASLSQMDAITTDWEMIFENVNESGLYCATDYDYFIETGYDIEKLKLNSNTVIIDVHKGVYRFTNYTEIKGFDPYSKDTIIFSDSESVH